MARPSVAPLVPTVVPLSSRCAQTRRCLGTLTESYTKVGLAL